MNELLDPAAGWRVNEIAMHTYNLDGWGYIDVRRAWRLDGELRDIPIDELESVLDDPSWEGESPRRIAHKDPHWTLILEADLAYPIIVTTLVHGGLEIIDGRHRVVKAWLLGMETVRARVVAYDELRAMSVDDMGQWMVKNA